LVRRALETAADTGADEYLEVPEGAPAIAAAEVVAAAAGRPPARDSYNERALDWAAENAELGSPEMRALAQRAVLRVGADESEFPQLWIDEADEATWVKGLAGLRTRLD